MGAPGLPKCARVGTREVGCSGRVVNTSPDKTKPSSGAQAEALVASGGRFVRSRAAARAREDADECVGRPSCAAGR